MKQRPSFLGPVAACLCLSLVLSFVTHQRWNSNSDLRILSLNYQDESRGPQHPMVLLNKARDIPEWKTNSRSHKVFSVFITLKVLKQVQNNLVIRILYPSIKKKSLLYEAIHTWLKYTSCDIIKRQFEMGLLSSEKPNR